MPRQERKAQNEVWFREVNEKLERRALAKHQDAWFEIVCECDREDCTERMPVDYAEYELVRAAPTHFIVAQGHVDPGLERVVTHGDAYDIVAKVGEAALVAEHQNPRG